MEKLTEKEKEFLLSLSSPKKIQQYLESIPFNHEKGGETCSSPRQVLIRKSAHCLEGGFLASIALILQQREPLLLSLRTTEEDYDHVIAVYKENGYFGAISKTNHAVLGFRDPVYSTVRELAMSYFHEYFLLTTGKKTMRGYSKLINMKRFGTDWVTSDNNLFEIAEAIYDSPHRLVVPIRNEIFLREATAFEREHAKTPQDKV